MTRSTPASGALQTKSVEFARCRRCARAWLPESRECPFCLHADWQREVASGRGRLISWCTYHVAYSEELKHRLPYTIGIVELDEGPRLVSAVAEDSSDLAIDTEVYVELQTMSGAIVPMLRVMRETSTVEAGIGDG